MCSRPCQKGKRERKESREKITKTKEEKHRKRQHKRHKTFRTFTFLTRFPFLASDRFMLEAFWAPRRGQDAPRCAQDAPRRTQDAARCANTRKRRLKRPPRRGQDAPRRLQDAPRRSYVRCLADVGRFLDDVGSMFEPIVRPLLDVNLHMSNLQKNTAKPVKTMLFLVAESEVGTSIDKQSMPPWSSRRGG